MNTENSEANMWKVVAGNMARDGANPQRIATFLRTKGVPAEEANALAESVCNEAKKKIQPAKLVRNIIGWSLVGIGSAIAVGSFFTAMHSGGTILIPSGFILLGCAILWAPELLGMR